MTEKEVQRRKEIDQVIAEGKYQDTWESLQQYEQPRWFRDAKFGIFIHWGVYSVPAFANEWYPRNMYIQGSKEFEHHVETYGPHTKFGYKDFIPMFRAEKFDPETWIELFKKAGAKYIVPVAEHHDGFQMYRSEISHWNAAEMGPGRDVLGELSEEAKKQGLYNCASSHRIEHWFFMGHGKEFDSDIKEPMQRGDFYWPAMQEPDHQDLFSVPAPNREFLEDWLLRTCEIIDRYQPKILYFDWWIQHEAVRPYLRKAAAYYYNRALEWEEEVVICYKHDAFMFGTAVVDMERGQFADVKPFHWQTDEAIALNSWCYTPDNEYRPAAEILQDFVDIVSKNGNLLLNVGPKADGTFSEEETKVLEEIGEWLQVNGEAIYGSKVWRKYGEGPTRIVEGQFADSIKKNFTSEDVRYTMNGSCLYGIAMRSSENGIYHFPALGDRDASHAPEFHGIIQNIEILGFEESTLEWERKEEELILRTTGVESDRPVVFRISLK